MDKYLSIYGWHFSKAMAKFAAEKFCKVELLTPEIFDKITKNFPNIRAAKGYDSYFLIAKFKTIFPKFDETLVLAMVESYLTNSYENSVFTHFYSDCIAESVPIIWEDQI